MLHYLYTTKKYFENPKKEVKEVKKPVIPSMK